MTIYDVRVTKQFHVTPVFLSWYLLCSTFTFVSRSEDDLTNQNIKKNVGVCGRTRERGQNIVESIVYQLRLDKNLSNLVLSVMSSPQARLCFKSS